MKPQTQKLMEYARRRGMIRARDLGALRVPRAVLKRLVDAERLVRRSRGVYTVPDYEPTEHTDLAEVALRVPRGVICLLSALRFHELTTQNPLETWVMIRKGDYRPKITHPAVRIIGASGRAFTEGVDIHEIEGVQVRVTGPAKTVADCFRYRRLIGTDVALEALRDCWRQRKATMDEIYRYAKLDRVANLMRPYMESLT